MGSRILSIGIMDIVGRYQRDPRLLAESEHALVDRLLLRDAMVLKFQEEISLAEDIFQLLGCRHSRLITPILQGT